MNPDTMHPDNKDGSFGPVRTIAFHLPQFHPIPENDAWWGKGFTEWTNVTSARPLVPGHYQPHLPADLGFCDLRLAEVRAAQAQLAAEYGIAGFCYYHYWFNGRRILHRPVDEIVTSGQPDFPFCLCWANENWTRAWDGGTNQVLLRQEHSAEDDLAHIEHLQPVLTDQRYIRVGGKPLLLVYRTELLPDPARTADIWRTRALATGVGELFLVRVESFRAEIDPTSIGFDAAVEFAPDWRLMRPLSHGFLHKLLSRIGLYPDAYFRHRFADYGEMAKAMLTKPAPTYQRYRCVMPGWDNTPRHRKNATVFTGSTPEIYGAWLHDIMLAERERNLLPDERLVFVNAWNEWGEGCHLEPDQRWGRAYLEAHRAALLAAGAAAAA